MSRQRNSILTLRPKLKEIMADKIILIRKSSLLPNKKRYAVVCFCTLNGLTCSLAYAHLGAEFGGISQNQSYGLIFSTASSVLLLIVGLLSCLYFARVDTTYLFPIKMMILMTIQIGLCITGIVFFVFLGLPNKTEMKQFVITKETGKFSGALSRLQEELQCCGIDSYEDYKYTMNEEISWEVPSSCCERKGTSISNCEYPQNVAHAPPDFKTGCLSEISNVQDLATLAPTFYLTLNITRFLVLGLASSSILLLITLFSYFHLLHKRHIGYAKNLSATTQTGSDRTSDCTSTSTSIVTPAISPTSTIVKIVDPTNESPEPVPASGSELKRSERISGQIKNTMLQNEENLIHQSKMHSMLALDFVKFNELSLEHLPGSLSQLSNFIYGPISNLDSSNNLRANKFV